MKKRPQIITKSIQILQPHSTSELLTMVQHLEASLIDNKACLLIVIDSIACLPKKERLIDADIEKHVVRLVSCQDTNEIDKSSFYLSMHLLE